MSRTCIAAFAVAASLSIAVGCGSSTPSSSSGGLSGGSSKDQSAAHSAALTRAELLEKGDAICYRVNAKRGSTFLSTRESFAQLMPPLAAVERAGANEMSKLTPPPSMKEAWERLVSDSRTVAYITGYFHTWAEASNLKLSKPVDGELARAQRDIKTVAKQAGFKDCARFS